MTTACLWNDIDSYLISALTTDMGAASAYSTLKLASTPLLADQFEPAKVTFPGVIIVTGEAEHSPGPHGDAVVHLDIRYPYWIVPICSSSTFALAKADAKTLAGRVRDVLRSRYALGGLAATGGEVVTQTEIGATHIEVRGPNAGAYLGVAIVEFDVFAEI
jgi:hypothetical protein